MTLIYDATTHSTILGVSIIAALPLFMIGLFLIGPLAVAILRWRALPIRILVSKVFRVVLMVFGLATPMIVAILVVSAHFSAQRKAIENGHFLSATGRLTAVKFDLFGGGGRGRRQIFTERDVLTLSQGSSFEIECGRILPEEPDRTGFYTCLNAQIGDDVTVDSTVSLGMLGAVPALRVWRRTGG